ncbi:hypothetical protein KAI04_01005 [Candidatus Pacearchaeota archaeon]|nr:hypothetical protein [Candidatus Pacearchaeota archaeon]
MDECFNCGVSIKKVRLFDAISDEGLTKICERCSQEEHIPIIRRPTTFQLKESERKQSFYEKATISLGESTEREFPAKQEQEVTLREIVDRNYEQKVSKDVRPRPEMINNFHWVIMRARRMKKITQTQLAVQVAESEAAIKMAEQGILPEDDYRLVNKLENYLGIKIIRPEFTRAINPSKMSRKLSFDMDEARILTIDDLRRLKQTEITDIDENIDTGFHEDEIEERELEEVEEINLMAPSGVPSSIELEGKEIETPESIVSSDKENISQEEMDRILFGK